MKFPKYLEAVAILVALAVVGFGVYYRLVLAADVSSALDDTEAETMADADLPFKCSTILEDPKILRCSKFDCQETMDWSQGADD